jgi:hypothetical protein
MNQTQRDIQFMELRPDIVIDEDRASLDQESFQNEALRPILKLQNNIILHFFSLKIAEVSSPTDPKEKLLFIENTIRKDAVLRNQLIGCVIGLFTFEEFSYYLQNSSSLNKRISQLLIKRIQDQL